jgi:hypothetical protein
VFDRLRAAGLSVEGIEAHLAAGRVHVDGESVTDPTAAAPAARASCCGSSSRRPTRRPCCAEPASSGRCRSRLARGKPCQPTATSSPLSAPTAT